MIVIGVDPGTATTGYGIIEDDNSGNLHLLDYGVITTPSSARVEDRLKKIYDNLINIVALHQPVSGAVEKLFFKNNVTNAISVSQARGVILLALANSGITVNEYAPTEVKAAVSGYGGAEKSQVQTMVKAILQLQEIPKPDDAADALAIAICHIHSVVAQDLAKNGE